MSLENIKLRKELQATEKKLKKKLENKQKVIRYYRKENKKLREDYKVLWILNDEIRRVNENLRKENKKLKDDVEYFRQIYLDLKKMCEDDGYLLTDEEVTKLFNLDEIRHKK